MCEDEYDPNSGLSVFQFMMAGSFAGMMEHVAMFPIDTVKTHVQSQKGEITQVYRSIYDMIRVQGVSRMWRGVQSMFVGSVPAHAAYFSIFESSKKALGVDGNSHKPVASMAVGAISVMAHDSIMTPLDVCKQRLQLGFYRGLWDGILTIFKSEGFRGFYASYTTTLFMNIPYHAVLVATNESLKVVFNNEGETLTGFFLSGAGAGAVAAALTNPLDVAKTRLQTQSLTMATGTISTVSSTVSVNSSMTPKIPAAAIHTTAYRPGSSTSPSCSSTCSSSHQNHYSGLINTLKTIAKEEGIKGFTRGVVPRLLFHAPAAAISWTSYEFMKSVLLGNEEQLNHNHSH